MTMLEKIWNNVVNAIAAIYNLSLTAWHSLADEFVPSAREGFPYVMRSVISSLGASSSNTPFTQADLTNNTSNEFVVDHFRFEAGTAAGLYATGGTAGSYLGTNDYNIRIRITDQSKNAPLMATPVEIGLLIDPHTRQYRPKRQIVLQGGQNSFLTITADNSSNGAITNVYVAVHGYMRSRINPPQ